MSYSLAATELELNKQLNRTETDRIKQCYLGGSQGEFWGIMGDLIMREFQNPFRHSPKFPKITKIPRPPVP